MSNEKETREILNKTIAESQAVLDKAKADLANLDKPKYRFGDYGTAEIIDGDKIFIINKQFKNSISNYQWLDEDNMWANRELSNIQIFGNCIDDLKRNQVDLKEFEVSGQYDKDDHKTLICKQNNYDDINIYIHTSSSNFTIDQAIEIHKKLGQVIATKQRSLKK